MSTETDLQHLRRAIALARSAAARGDDPFGAVLVSSSGEVLAEGLNTTITERDCTGHAELNLARLASQRFPPDVLASSTMYCSTEPCAMCAAALHWLGLGRIVFGVRSERLYEIVGAGAEAHRLRLPVRDVFARSAHRVEILGPLIEGEAEAVHR
jgi:tRNA(Arg) A34 adenosine deaminase TadA